MFRAQVFLIDLLLTSETTKTYNRDEARVSETLVW